MAEVSTATAVETGRHLHRCQSCGVIWGHGNMMGDDVEAHKCPKCGKQEWRPFSGGQAVKRPAPANPASQYRAYLQALLTVAAVVMVSIVLGQLILDFLLPGKE